MDSLYKRLIISVALLGLAFPVFAGAVNITVPQSPNYGYVLRGNSSGTYTPVATSSLGLPTFGYLFPNNATTTGLGIYASTTIGAGTASSGLTISGNATTTGSAYIAGSLGLSIVPTKTLDVNGTTRLRGTIFLDNAIQVQNSNSSLYNFFFPANGVFAFQNMNIGVSTTSPWAKLAIHANNGDTNTRLFVVASSTATATTTLFSIDNTGKVAIGSTTPAVTILTVYGATANQAIRAYGAGTQSSTYAEMFSSSLGSGTFQGSGSTIFTSAGGQVFLRSTATNLASINDTTAGNISLAFGGGKVAIASSTPWALLSLHASASATNQMLFAISSSTSAFATSTLLTVDRRGYLTMGTTTPVSLLTAIGTNPGNNTAATTTVDIGDYSTTTSRACFNTKNIAGGAISFYFSGTTMVVENNRCR